MTTFRVLGMTCSHCAGFVSEELEAVAGVESVEVELSTGQVSLTTTRAIAAADIRTAVEAAGYEVDP